MKVEQSVLKHWHIKIIHRGITQKKAYSIKCSFIFFVAFVLNIFCCLKYLMYCVCNVGGSLWKLFIIIVQF